jgi:hypothetical protein
MASLASMPGLSHRSRVLDRLEAAQAVDAELDGLEAELFPPYARWRALSGARVANLIGRSTSLAWCRESCPCTDADALSRQGERTGERCKAWAIRGASACRVHGGMAPQVRARGEARIMEAEARANGKPVEPRDPAEALVEAAGEADMMAQRLKAQASENGRLDPVNVALFEWLDRVGRLAKMIVDARMAEQLCPSRRRARPGGS